MKVLLLNSTYVPIKFISERKAIKLILNDKVEKVSAWETGIKHEYGYCFVCGNDLKFYPKPFHKNHEGTKHSLCSKECLDLFDLDPLEFLMPSIVRLKKYAPIKRKEKRYSRSLIFRRDNYSCQYCSKHLKPHDLTIDHVIPRAVGGETTWENCVTCCKPCNSFKGDRTPRQAGLVLLKKPRKPNDPIWDEFKSILSKHQDWEFYLFRRID